MPATLHLTQQDVRRLAIARQHLIAAPIPGDTPRQQMLNLIRDLGCLQLDPISVVERSHILVLWSRLGRFDEAEFNALAYEDKQLFDYFAHAASYVLMEDYPLYRWEMQRPWMDTATSQYAEQYRQWHAAMEALDPPMSEQIRTHLRTHGPALSRDIPDATERIVGHRWFSGKNLNRMIERMWSDGELMVAGRVGGHRLWDLTEHHLPAWAPRDDLSDWELTLRTAPRAIRALGAATITQIKWHFTRHRYPELTAVLKHLVAEGVLLKATVDGQKDPYYLHVEDAARLDDLRGPGWQPQTVLLSPFDNLICDRARTEALWNFFFRIEIYVPASKRTHGYYVLPILHGDALIGRVSLRMDRKTRTLHAEAVYAEPTAPGDPETITAIRTTLQNLATFLAADNLNIAAAPPLWSALTT